MSMQVERLESKEGKRRDVYPWIYHMLVCNPVLTLSLPDRGPLNGLAVHNSVSISLPGVSPHEDHPAPLPLPVGAQQGLPLYRMSY